MKNEIKLHSEVLDNLNGPELIMLHGWGHSHKNLLHLGYLLNDYFNIHLIDLPGFGESKLPDESANKKTEWDTFKYAEEIINYMNKNNIKCASLLGHSFGGRICLQLASNFPDRVNDIILIDSAGLKPIRNFESRLRMRKIKVIGAIIHLLKSMVSISTSEKLYKWYSDKYGSSDYKNAGELKQILIKTVTENLEENAKAIKKKTLILWGEKDNSTPLYMAELLHRFISNSTLIVMKNKGHEPFNGLGSHLCAFHINNFLNNMKHD